MRPDKDPRFRGWLPQDLWSRMRSAHLAVCALVVVCLLQRPTIGQAQAACTYERCALRVHQTFWSLKVAQGAADSTVASMGWMAPRIDALAGSTDSTVRQLYYGYRSAVNRSGRLALVGLAAFIGSVVVLNGSNEDGAAAVLLGVGFGLTLAGAAERTRGIDRLHQAIWRYNWQYAR